MALVNVVATVTVDGVTYKATVDRSSRSERPTTIEGSDGARHVAEWDSSWGRVIDYGEIPDAAIDALSEALCCEFKRVLSGR